MKIDSKKLMKKATGASTGIAVAAAFFNTALLVVQLVRTVSEKGVLSGSESPRIEDKN